MGEVIISSKYQIVIPRDVRKQLGLKAGQKLKVVVKGWVINLVPEVPLSELRGFLKGMDMSGIRDDEEGYAPGRFVRLELLTVKNPVNMQSIYLREYSHSFYCDL